MKDLEALSQKTGIPIVSFKEALSISLEPCLATTVDEAKKAYAHTSIGSEAKKAALAKWNELSMKEVNSATTVDEAKKAYNRAPGGSETEEAALRRMHDLF